MSLKLLNQGCKCDVKMDAKECASKDKMMQFVNGLNGCYEAVRNQILHRSITFHVQGLRFGPSN